MFKITNGTEKDFEARCDGKEFLVPKGQAVYCEDDVAAHIFGLGNEDKSAVLARHGWAHPGQSLAEGMKILNAFTFAHMAPVYDAPLALVDHGPAPVGQGAAGTEGGTDGSADAPAAVAARRDPTRHQRQPPAA